MRKAETDLQGKTFEHANRQERLNQIDQEIAECTQKQEADQGEATRLKQQVLDLQDQVQEAEQIVKKHFDGAIGSVDQAQAV